MNCEALERVVSNRWWFAIGIWMHRKTISDLCVENSNLKAKAQTALHSEAKANRKCANLWKFISVRHRLDVPAADGSIRKILREAEGKMGAIVVFIAFLSTCGASAQPLLRNFFSTNPAPVVQATAGSNVFVTFSTAGQTRTYKIDVPALGGVSNVYVAAGTGVTITTNGSLFTFTVSTNYASTNYVNTATNDLNTAITNRINTATNDVSTRTTNATNDLNTAIVARINTATNDVATRTTNATNDLNTVLRTYFSTNGGSPSISGQYQSYGLLDEFIAGTHGGGRVGPFVFTPTTSGTAAAIVPGGDLNCPGSWIIKDGTATSVSFANLGNAGGGANNPILVKGVWTNEWRFSVSITNSPATNQNYFLAIGFLNSGSGATPTEGYYLQYYTNDTHFQYVMARSSTYVTNLTTLVPVAGTFYKFRVVVTSNSTATNAVFTIDGGNGYTNSTASQLSVNAYGIGAFILKVDGATSENAELDYCYLGFGLDASR